MAQSTVTISRENEKVDSLYYYFNNGSDKKAYQQAQHLLTKFKNNKALANTNLLLAYYHNKYAAIDSSIYYTHQALKSKSTVNDSLGIRLTILAYQLLAMNNKKKGYITKVKSGTLRGQNSVRNTTRPICIIRIYMV
ncbi:hypothetical protein [Formosa algae]|uniref:hypothetical protein n=1 Tax=Formosa algae TaxID=225843 RepID=UPI000CCDFA26|nr:hypothetical protein [Formosa algae]PNW26328.1 hypothetical protein BKP44_17450 [Formosa algae]